MSVEQFYYTSWVDTSPGGEAGFHMRGASPGLTQEDKKALTDLISYAIPPRLDPRQLDTHPVALRYSYISPEKAALLCCQSTGADEQGRTGNFFAHAIMLDPETFTHTPPAFYWRSPFWRASDATPGSVLPALPDFDAEPSLDLDAVWRFIGDERRREWLYHLISAVIHSASTQRRIVIVDTPEHVALWVAGISLLLPSRYRPLLTFATYHYSPYRAGYLITGTRSDVDFQLSPADYMSFFVLDTENSRISEGKDSTYARFAADCARPDLYNERMLGLLSLCDRLFPPDGAISDRLDDAAAYYLRVMANSGAVDPSARRALSSAIETLGKAPDTGSDRLEDLTDAYTLLLTALPEAPDAGLIQDYERVAGMMRAADPQGATARLPRELWLATQLIVRSKAQEGRAVADVVRRVYGDQALGVGLNSPEYLRELARLSESAPGPAMLSVWAFAGPGIQPAAASAPAFTAMLKRTPGVTQAGLSPDSAQYIESLVSATREQARGWLRGIANDASIPPPVVQAYYYAVVSQMAPDARAPYRELMRDPDGLAAFEIQRDLSGADAGINFAILDRWAQYAKSQPESTRWISDAMNFLWRNTLPRDLPLIAKRSLLSQTVVSQLNAQSTGILLHEALKGIPLARPSGDDLAFCQQYRQNQQLTPPERVLIIGVLAMDNGQLDRNSALEVRKRFSGLGPEQYATESREFINRFFQQDVTRESHGEMVVATYSLQNNDAFWASYWSALLTLMIDARTAKKSAQLIGFWFDSSLGALGQFPYVVQAFFMGLPAVFDAAQKERGYRDAAREIDLYCANQQWYPLVRPMIAPERKGIMGIFGR